jgi:hypothetical protein
VIVHWFRFENAPGDIWDAVHALQGRRADFERLLETADLPPTPRPRVETPPMSEVRLPAVVEAALSDDDTTDAASATYFGMFRLDADGLVYSGQIGRSLCCDWQHPLVLDSAVVGSGATASVLPALAEPAPWGWRIARAGVRAQNPYLNFTAPGAQMQRADTLRFTAVTAADLPGRWPVVLHELVLRDRRTEERTRIEVVSRGDRLMLLKLFEKRPWEVDEPSK